MRSDIKDVQLLAHGFHNAPIDFELTWWTGQSPLAIRRSRDQVVGAVKHTLDDVGIEIPYPYRVMIFKRPAPVVMANPAGDDSAASN